MKLMKIISVVFVFIFLFEISNSNISAQTAGNIIPIEKNGLPVEKKSAQPEIAKTENISVQKNPDSTNDSSFPKDVDNERYKIGYQDTVEVNVYRHPELNQSVPVNPDGTIFLPRIDTPVVAICKTEGELKDNITALYKTYLRNPFVSVRVVNQLSQSFGVVGAVQKPGTFYINRRIRLFELLSLAGGPDVEFAGGKIQLARLGNVSGCQEKSDDDVVKNKTVITSFSLQQVTEGLQNPWMEPGDIISVLQAEQAYVIGNVNKPTNILLREPVTLTTAIAQAHGTDKNAKTDKVIIQRQEKGSLVKSELIFNLKDIQSKKIADPVLQANDIVSVGTDKIKSISNGLFSVVKGALPNAVYRIP